MVDNPAQVPQVDIAVTEMAFVFGQNFRSDLGADGIEAAKKILDLTLARGLGTGGYEWEEPFRSFVLHRVEQIARQADASVGAGMSRGEALNKAYQDVADRTTKILGRNKKLFESICRC